MKTAKTLLACSALLWGGCFMVPSPYADQLNPVARRYNSVTRGAPRSELEAELGKSSREENDGARVWETRIDELNYARLTIWFDPQDKAEHVEVTQAHGKSVPGYRASAVSTRSK